MIVQSLSILWYWFNSFTTISLFRKRLYQSTTIWGGFVSLTVFFLIFSLPAASKSSKRHCTSVNILPKTAQYNLESHQNIWFAAHITRGVRASLIYIKLFFKLYFPATHLHLRNRGRGGLYFYPDCMAAWPPCCFSRAILLRRLFLHHHEVHSKHWKRNKLCKTALVQAIPIAPFLLCL